jgi:hypothetical protein
MPAVTDERAADIGLIGYNPGSRTSITQTMSEQDIDYEEVADHQVRGKQVSVYRYVADGETRWVAEWGERVAVDEVMWASLVFDAEPDAGAIDRGELLAASLTEDG